ncbi:MAG: NACHT domain-containing protein [Gallionella sp.]
MSSLTPTELALIQPATEIALALLKPIAQKAWKWADGVAESAKFELSFGAFDTHLQNAYKRHSYFTSLVFKNEQKKLLEHYLPLTLLKHPENSAQVIDQFPHELMSAYRRLLIVDTAGMGKSTISKYLFLTCIREKPAIPILIELRKLSDKESVLDFIVKSTSNVAGETSRELIIKLISSGRFLFLFDGYDEISESNRAAVTADIAKFIAEAPDNWYVMTSRDEASLSSFPEFQRFTIKPLDKNEAYQLLRLYDQEARCVEDLIAKLEGGAYANVHEFLTNPLLTSLLFKSFEFKRAVPIRKHIFYRQVFEALFETHDLMKEDYQRGKRSGLDIDQFDELLRYLSFLTYKSGKFSYNKTELLAFIEKTKELTTHKLISASNVIHDLTHSVPLMVEEGNDIRWVHRSMQEYFAAQWVCRDSKEKQKELFIKMYKDLKHQNLIALCADIDPLTFKRTVLKEIAINLINEYESSYNPSLTFPPPKPTDFSLCFIKYC